MVSRADEDGRWELEDWGCCCWSGAGAPKASARENPDDGDEVGKLAEESPGILTADFIAAVYGLMEQARAKVNQDHTGVLVLSVWSLWEGDGRRPPVAWPKMLGKAAECSGTMAKTKAGW